MIQVVLLGFARIRFLETESSNIILKNKIYETQFIKASKRRKIMRKAIFLSIILLTIILISGCAKKEQRPIKISINVWPGYAHAFIAKEKGFFKKNNVDVELILKKNITESAELYKNGEVDGFFDVLADVIMFNSEGITTKVVYISDYSDAGDVIMGRVGLKSVSSLKGKVISFEGVNTFSHIFVLKTLEKAGLKEADVKFENIPALDVLTALEQRKIDAGHTWEPVTSQALKKGYKKLAKAGDIPGIISDVLSFNTRIIKERPEDIKRIIKSLAEAKAFVFSNREEAMKLMAKAEEMSVEEMDGGFNDVRHLDLKENVEAMGKKGAASLHSFGEGIADFYFKRGQLSKMPNIDEVIEPMFVNDLTRG